MRYRPLDLTLTGRGAAILVLLAACGSACSSSSDDPGGTKATASDPNHPSNPAASDDPSAAPNGPNTPDAPPGPYEHFDINHVLSTGQSNSVGNEAKPPLTLEQPFGNIKFDTGVIPGRQCDGAGCKSYAKPRAFVPLVEGDSFFDYPVETMSSSLANQASKLAKDRHDILVSLHGRSGNTYECLRKGGCSFGIADGYPSPFAEGMTEVSDAMALAKKAGKSYVVRAVTAIHGESDHYAYTNSLEEFPMPATNGQGKVSTYGDALVEWQQDYETSVKAITGQSTAVPMLILQMSSWNDVRYSPIPTWMLDAHVRTAGKVVLVAPGYPIGYAADCLHFTNHGERRIGEYFGKAYARIVVDGKKWEPLRPLDVTLTGNVITARFAVPKPPLVLDTNKVKDPGNYGFEFVDGSGAPPAITNVAIAGPDTVTITLASAPNGADKRLRYAYTATPETCPGPEHGPRGNLRDSDDTPSLGGYDLSNWSVHFDEPVK